MLGPFPFDPLPIATQIHRGCQYTVGQGINTCGLTAGTMLCAGCPGFGTCPRSSTYDVLIAGTPAKRCNMRIESQGGCEGCRGTALSFAD